MNNSNHKKQTSKIRKEGVIFGIMTIVIGLLHLKSGRAREGFPVTLSASMIIILIGVFITIYSSIRKIVLKAPNEIGENKICPKCRKIYNSGINENKCPECNCDLENVKGFLERHPDFLKSSTKNT